MKVNLKKIKCLEQEHIMEIKIINMKETGKIIKNGGKVQNIL